MLEVKNIRAGNRLQLKESATTVTILQTEKDGFLLDAFPQSIFCPAENVAGIPLTTTLLKKLLFTNENNENEWTGNGITLTEKPDGFFYGLRILKSKAKMQYLHELQNYVEDFYSVFRQEVYSLDITLL